MKLEKKMLSKIQIDRYHKDGFVVPDFKMPENIINKIEESHDRLLSNHPEFKNYCPAILSYDESFLEFCSNEIILNYVEQLIGPDFALWNSSFFAKPAHNGFETPWHQDGPYYFIDGIQNVSFWSPVDPVTEASLRCVAGSHLWSKPVLPTRWLSEENFYPEADKYMEVPDPDAEGMKIKEWNLEPGDAVAFNYGILHGARGNDTGSRRRAFSLRLLGDDCRYIERPGPTSPPFPNHGMKPGDRLREDWFPTIYEEA